MKLLLLFTYWLPRVAGYDENVNEEASSFLLAGWYDITTLLVDFMLNKPENAELVRELLYDVDIVNIIDKLSTYQPTIFWILTLSTAYLAAYLVGTPTYFYLRSSKECGGERTQDITESYKCVLQALSIGYIVVFALLLVHIAIMIGTMSYIRPLVSGPSKAGLFANIKDLDNFATKISMALSKECDSKFHTLGLFHTVATSSGKGGLVDALYNFFLPILRYDTDHSNVFSQKLFHEYAELALVHDTVSSMLQAQQRNIERLQENFTRFVAERVGTSYNGRIRNIVDRIPAIVSNVSDLKVSIAKDTLKYKTSLDQFLSRLLSDERSSITSVFTRFVYYSSLAVMMAIVLTLLHVGAFTVGIANHDITVVPTQRSENSENAGLVLLLIGTTAVFNVFVIGYSTYAMVVGVTGYAYLCSPSSVLTIDPLDWNSHRILDEVWDLVWPKDTRGVLFSEFSPGTAYSMCQGTSRYMEIAPEVVKRTFYDIRNRTVIVMSKLKDITVDADSIFKVSGGDKLKLGITVDKFDKVAALMQDKVISLIANWSDHALRPLRIRSADEDEVNLQCEPVFEVYREAFSSFCGLTLKNFNSWWLAMYICLILFGGLVLMSHFTSKYFLKMINYTLDGSEVESSSEMYTTEMTTTSTSESHLVRGHGDVFVSPTSPMSLSPSSPGAKINYPQEMNNEQGAVYPGMMPASTSQKRPFEGV